MGFVTSLVVLMILQQYLKPPTLSDPPKSNPLNTEEEANTAPHAQPTPSAAQSNGSSGRSKNGTQPSHQSTWPGFLLGVCQFSVLSLYS